jgi:hypothetical protein
MIVRSFMNAQLRVKLADQFLRPRAYPIKLFMDVIYEFSY